MARRERGVMQLIWKSFIGSLRQSKKRILIGEDYYGTKYYEETTKNSTTHKKPSRYFVPVNETDHEQEIPAEWEAWLRYRRREPPTMEELQKNYAIAMMKKRNAAELEAMHASSKEQKSFPVTKKGYESFPTYEEYKDDGQQYKPKIEKDS